MAQTKFLTEEQAQHLLDTFAGWMLIEPWLHSLALANRSSRTIREYRKLLHQYFLETQNFSLDVSPEQVEVWVAMMRDRGLKPRTIAGRLTTLSSFFNCALRRGLMATNPVDALPPMRLPAKLPKAFTKDEVRRLFDAIDRQPGERGDRDRILFRFMYLLGLRVSEAVAIRMEDLDLNAGTIRVFGKGSKERLLYLKPEFIDMLRDWLAGQDCRREWLFPGQDGHLSARTAQIHMPEYGKAAGIRGARCHRLRHSCAVHHLLDGAPLPFVQKQLGHASLKTTGDYLQLVDEDRRRISVESTMAI